MTLNSRRVHVLVRVSCVPGRGLRDVSGRTLARWNDETKYRFQQIQPICNKRDPDAQFCNLWNVFRALVLCPFHVYGYRTPPEMIERHWFKAALKHSPEWETHQHTQTLDLHMIVLLIECQGFNERHRHQMDKAPVEFLCVCVCATERQLRNLHLFNSISPNVFMPAAKKKKSAR